MWACGVIFGVLIQNFGLAGHTRGVGHFGPGVTAQTAFRQWCIAAFDFRAGFDRYRVRVVICDWTIQNWCPVTSHFIVHDLQAFDRHAVFATHVFGCGWNQRVIAARVFGVKQTQKTVLIQRGRTHRWGN